MFGIKSYQHSDNQESTDSVPNEETETFPSKEDQIIEEQLNEVSASMLTDDDVPVEPDESLPGESLEQQAQEQYLDDQLAVELREEFNMEDPAEDGTHDSQLDGEGNDGVAPTARIMELHHRQKSCQEMRRMIDKSLRTLSEIGEGTDVVLDFLLKAEPDLTHLEQVESQHSNLREMSIQLAERSMDLKARLARQEHEIEILEALKKRMRGIIERNKAEIARINETKEELSSNVAARDILTNRLSQDKNLLKEKNLHLEARCKEAETELENRTREGDAAREKISTLQNQLTVHERQIESLIEERDQYLQKARSILADYEELERSHRETVAKLEECVHSEEATRKEYEEKLKNKDARILKLESSNGVLSNQVLISGEVIASLNARLEDEAHHAELPAAQPAKNEHHV